MKNNRFATRLFIVILSFCTLAQVIAEDIEIYFGNAGATTSHVKPNILIALDTSSSMRIEVDSTGQSRLEHMKDALNNLINDSKNVNIGLMRFNDSGGSVIYPVSDIDDSVDLYASGKLNARINSGSNDAFQRADNTVILDDHRVTLVEAPSADDITVELGIGNNSDDAEERLSTSAVYTDNDRLTVINNPGEEQLIGLRFDNTSGISASTQIVDARIEFSNDDPDPYAYKAFIASTIQGELGGDTGTFSSSNKLSTRSLTSTSVYWDVQNEFDGSGKMSTSNLAAIIQEVINDGGWNSGDPLTLIIKPKYGDGLRYFTSRDKSATASPKLRLTYNDLSSGTEKQTVGLRFDKIKIPKNTSITSATLQFVASQQASAGASSLTIQAQNSGNAPAFSASSNDLSYSNRPRLSTSKVWSPSDWTPGSVHTVDITSVVESVINHSDWCSNNALALFVSNFSAGRRIAESYDSDPTLAPVLTINYDTSSIPASTCYNREERFQVINSSDDAEEVEWGQFYTDSDDLELNDLLDWDPPANQTVGIRFNSVTIPTGTTIEAAYLEFTAKESNSELTNLTVYGEDIDHSPTFSDTNRISTRSKTSASASWSSVQAWSEGITYRSPDIGNIVQSIINRGGWNSGNGMSFIIEGNGIRQAYTYDGNKSAAPRLIIQIKNTGPSAANFTVRDKLLQIVEEMQYQSFTPIVDALYEGARYFRGEGLHLGNVRGTEGSERRHFARVSHPDSYTGGTLNREANCDDGNLDAQSCVTENISGSPTYTSPISHTCQQENHLVLLTDGDATANSSKTGIETLISPTSCENRTNAHQDCGTELTAWLSANDQAPSIAGDQKITTHTIGFNFSSAWLDSLSTVGGGLHREASTAQDLTGVFKDFISSILDTNSTFAAPATGINQFDRLNHRKDLFFTLFKPSTNGSWLGNVKKYELAGTNNDIVDADGNAAIDPDTGFFKADSRSHWSSQDYGSDITKGGMVEQLPDPIRKVYSNTGVDEALDLMVNTTTGEHNVAVTKTMLGDAGMSDSERDSLLSWITGSDVLDEDGDDSTTDSRQTMAEALHSQPVLFTHGGDKTNTDLALLFGTNDGKFRAVNGNTGEQLWSFIPTDLLPISKTIFDQSSPSHVYGVDGSPVLWVNDPDFDGETVDLSGTDNFAYVYFGLRRGGRNYYALDVTKMNQPEFKWEIKGGSGDFVELGQTWSKPIKTKISYQNSGNTFVKDVLIFSGGYDPDQDDVNIRTLDNQGRAMFIVDAENGDLIWSGGPTSSFVTTFPDMKYSIPASPSVIDLNSDGLADQIYVGDMGGQVWRFDIDNGTIDLSALVSGGVIANLAADNNAANTRRFYHSPDLVLSKNNLGQRFLSVLIGSGFHAHPLNTDATDRFYRLDVPNPAQTRTDYSPTSVITESTLYDATDNHLGSTDSDTLSVAQAALNSSQGWYFNLPNLGEKVLSTPLTLNGLVIFTTFEPTPNTANCEPEAGTTREYVVKLKDATPGMDVNADGDFTVSDRSDTLKTGSIVSKVRSIFTADGSSGGTAHCGPEKCGPNPDPDRIIKTFWYQE